MIKTKPTVVDIVTHRVNRSQFLHIDGRLPSLNEYINAERSSKYAAATMKKNAENKIAVFITQNRLKPVTRPVKLFYTWYLRDRRKDLDNIAFAQKFVQDALVFTDILPNDGQKWVVGFSHDFKIDAHEGVSVELYEQEKT